MKDRIDDEIILAISAAIASMETKPGYKLVVKSFRRIPQTSPVWATTGRIESMGKNI
ncbi:MAG: sodium pump decarboxylase subunit gamma [Bacillota bacterium]